MINTEYYRNEYVKKNREECVQICMYQILKSLHLYKIEKGRLFAYLNRIAKNNLTQFNDKHKKYDEENINFSGIINNDSDNFNTTVEENIDNIISDDEFDEKIINTLETSSTNFIPKPKNKVIKCKSSLYIIYKYINFLFTTINYYYNNKNEYNDLLDNMKYDTSADFDFNVPL